MRSEEHKKYLASLTDREKAELTSYRSFSKRGNIIKKYRYRHLVNNELPNNVGEIERVLFYKTMFEYPNDLAWVEFGRIRAEYPLLRVSDLPFEDRSVKYRYHSHFIR